MSGTSPFRLSSVTLEEHSFGRRTREIEHERDIALYDLLESNNFRPAGSDGGPYRLVLGVEENRLIFDVRLADGKTHGKLMLSLTPFRRIVKDYLIVCESYFAAIGGSHTKAQIEAIDMGRRGLHDEGAELLRQRLKGKIEVDFDTARRLFTLICVLHLKA
ncbi:MAG: UPF0262 family protein [Alphaproteobacteria bacterium]|nr:UPF0262 family protein [Alphaproteobacteria bacterium]